jgi:hypothetical protein
MPAVSNSGSSNRIVALSSQVTETAASDAITHIDSSGNVKGLVGLSHTNISAANLRNSFCITNLANSAIVGLTPETDANYFLSVTPTTRGGVPAVGSNRIVSTTKTNVNFTVTVEAAPGVFASQCFDYILVR